MGLDLKYVLGFFNDAPQPLGYDDIVKSLNVADSDTAEFDAILKRLLDSGDVVKLKSNLYGAPSKMNLILGRVQVHPDGYGFIIPEDKTCDDLFVRPRQLREIMHNDVVIARKQVSNRTKKLEGKIIRIVKRANTHIIGKFQRKAKFGYLIPLTPNMLHDIYIPASDSLDAPDGVIASAEITRYPTKHLNPEGKIIRIFGDINDPAVEIEAVLYKHQINAVFPEDAIDQSASTELDISEKEIAKRVDLRETMTFTIDGEKAKDFDDAVSIERIKSGYRLFVSIADVSHYVREDSPLDKEAFARATSVYLLDKVVPMLPEKLSNDICSLRPNEDRLTFTVEMEFDPGGELVDYNFYKSIINSNYRLTYTTVKEILINKKRKQVEKYSEIIDDLQAMEELALILKNQRSTRGSIDFDLPDTDVVLDMQGRLENIIKAERNIAHQIIEEFMLATNETVAKHLNWLDIPSIYRVHEEPDREKLKEFKELVFNLGYHLKVTSRLFPKAFQRLLEEVKGQPEEMLINRVMLRTMKQAKYMPVNQGHFALATSDYTHFTSPIRRYPDLIVHRILSQTLTSKKTFRKEAMQFESVLTKITDHCSKQERVAEAAEREIIDLKKVQFMVDKIGDVFQGFISGVNSFGFFVELCELFIEGLVHVSSLRDDYYKFYEKEHLLVGNNLKKRFRLGDMVSVRVIKADVTKQEIDFELIEKIR